MSFGWSVGDIAFALKLLYTVSTALQESCGASSDFAETLGFLSTLQTTLQLLQSLDTVAFNPQSSESFKEQCQQIKIHVDTFLDDVLKYEPALTSTGKKYKLLSAPRKIQWALVMPSKIKSLQGRIGSTMLTVNTLMGYQALELVSRFQTAMPDDIQDRISHALNTAIDIKITPAMILLNHKIEALLTAQATSANSITQKGGGY